MSFDPTYTLEPSLKKSSVVLSIFGNPVTTISYDDGTVSLSEIAMDITQSSDVFIENGLFIEKFIELTLQNIPSANTSKDSTYTEFSQEIKLNSDGTASFEFTNVNDLAFQSEWNPVPDEVMLMARPAQTLPFSVFLFIIEGTASFIKVMKANKL